MAAWPWHLILQWAGGLAAIVIVVVTLSALRREHLQSAGAGAGEVMMFFAFVATIVLTLSTLLNFIFFVIR